MTGLTASKGKRDLREDPNRAEGGGKGRGERLEKGASFAAYSKGVRTDQDAFAALENFAGNSRQGFFAVFDGHGLDRRLADFAASHVPELLAKDSSLNSSPAAALSHAIRSTDEDYRKQDPEDYRLSGCTACCCLIHDGMIHVGNVGDSRAILIDSSGAAKALSRDHKADVEKSRITAAGGHVTTEGPVARVMGQLAISRSIGDGSLKEFVIAKPELMTHELTAENAYVVIASDGLWDVMKNKDVASLVRKSGSPKKAAQALMHEALKRWSLDDITIVVVDLSQYKVSGQANVQAQTSAQANVQANVQLQASGSAPTQGEPSSRSSVPVAGGRTSKALASPAHDQGKADHVTLGQRTASASDKSNHGLTPQASLQTQKGRGGTPTPTPTPTLNTSPRRQSQTSARGQGPQGQGTSSPERGGKAAVSATVPAPGVSGTESRQSQLKAQASSSSKSGASGSMPAAVPAPGVSGTSSSKSGAFKATAATVPAPGVSRTESRQSQLKAQASSSSKAGSMSAAVPAPGVNGTESRQSQLKAQASSSSKSGVSGGMGALFSSIRTSLFP